MKISNRVKTFNVKELKIKSAEECKKDREAINERWPFIECYKDLFNKETMQQLFDLLNWRFIINPDSDYDCYDFIADFYGGQISWSLHDDDVDECLANTLYRMVKMLRVENIDEWLAELNNYLEEE